MRWWFDRQIVPEQRLAESARVPFELQQVAETMAPACFMPGNSEVLPPGRAKRVRAEVRSSEGTICPPNRGQQKD